MYGSVDNGGSFYQNLRLPSFYTAVAGASGVAWILASSVFGGLGNSLEPISPLVWIHNIFLIVGFEYLSSQVGVLLSSFLTLVIQALGMTLSFNGVFSDGTISNTSATGVAFGFSLGIWLLYICFCLVPHYYYSSRYVHHPVILFVFPVTQTTVCNVIVGNIMGTFHSQGNAVLDYSPLRTFASIVGLSGVNFVVMLFGTVMAFVWFDRNIINFKRIKINLLVTATILAIVCCFIEKSDSFYQVDNSLELKPLLNVSCIFGQSIEKGDSDYETLWASTRKRIISGDNIILWSEAAVWVSPEDEEALLTRAKGLILHHNSSSYLGLTYVMATEREQFNRFVLLSPLEGEVLWSYQKAYPVPVVERGTVPGRADIPAVKTPFGIVGGAICFDLDHPQYLRQAGSKGVDILLQPSWTWGALNMRHFGGNALRAVENGFTLFRCSSDGVSGVVGPRGTVWHQVYTGHDPSETAQFSLPLWPRLPTFYTNVGFVFDWLCLVASVCFYVLIILPERWRSKVLGGQYYRSPPSLEHGLVGHGMATVDTL